MTTCWDILKIKKTRDKNLIKKAYRDLMKKFHPDLTRTPEKYRINTIKCAQINNAYQEAIKDTDFLVDLNEETYSENIAHKEMQKRENQFFVKVKDFVTIILALTGCATLYYGIFKFAELSEEYLIVKVIMMLTVGVFGILLIVTSITLTTVFISYLIVELLLNRLFPTFYLKLMWLITVVINSILAINGTIPPFNKMISKLDILNGQFDLFLVCILINFWPILLLADWLRTLVRYKKITDKGFLQEIEIK